MSSTWEALGRIGGMIPGVEPVAKGVARGTVQRLMGFWLIWHLYGGADDIENLVKAQVASRASAYRNKTEFYAVFGMTVDEFAPDLAREVRKAGVDRDAQ